MQSPRQLLREMVAKSEDPVAALRAVRERFGLSVEEAKKVWLEATGKTIFLTEREELLAGEPLRIVCPKCRMPDSIERKIHLLPPWLAYDGSKAIDAPGPRFVYGFWCKSCGVGFVPDHLLKDFGLEAIRGI